jgi:flavin reductase (DIM6/NTAB) family NADH-FMN oxidoreductase RutF
VILGLAPHHFTTELIRQSGRLILHQVAPAHMEHYWPFCLSKGRDVDKFVGLRVHDDPFGLPRLDPCIGYLSCQVFAQLNAGDRVYFWCDILDGEQYSDIAPLRQGGLIQMAGEDRLKQLKKDRELDAERLRLPFTQWRKALPPPGDPTAISRPVRQPS